MEDNIEVTENKSIVKKEMYGYAVCSLVLGIISFIHLMGLERAVAAVVFGVLALSGINKSGRLKGRKYALWGIALGIIYMVILLVIVIFKRGDILCALKQN